MGSEEKEQNELATAQYRDTLFAHAFMSQNPLMFEKLYPEIFGVDDEEVEWMTDPEDFESFMLENFGSVTG